MKRRHLGDRKNVVIGDMPRRQSRDRAAYFVHSIPCAGDLPYLDVGLADTKIYMTSDKSGRFEICTDFLPDLTAKQQRDDGIFKQPDWAVHVSNGTDQLFLHRNAGECMMRFQNPKSQVNILTLLTDAEALAVSTGFSKAFGDCAPLKRHRRKMKPLGSYYSYTVESVVVDPRITQ